MLTWSLQLAGGLPNGTQSLGLKQIQDIDKSFSKGMEKDRTDLSDPLRDLESPFDQKNFVIHGLLKIAGNSDALVNKRLEDIKTALKHGTVIKDVSGTSRINGAVRAGDNNGKEQ